MTPVRLSRINPVAQLSTLFIVTVVLLVTVDVLTPAIVVTAELGLLPAAGLTGRNLVRRGWPVLVGAGGVALVNVAFGTSTGNPADVGGGLALRVIGMALPALALVASIDPTRLADALTIHWRVSPRFAFGALAALRLIPLLGLEWESIRLARRTRGVDAGWSPLAAARLFAGAVFTLLVGAVRRGTRLATAMDGRGFDSGITRSNARGSVLHCRDYLFVLATVALCTTATAVSIAVGTWSPIFAG